VIYRPKPGRRAFSFATCPAVALAKEEAAKLPSIGRFLTTKHAKQTKLSIRLRQGYGGTRGLEEFPPPRAQRITEVPRVGEMDCGVRVKSFLEAGSKRLP